MGGNGKEMVGTPGAWVVGVGGEAGWVVGAGVPFFKTIGHLFRGIIFGSFCRGACGARSENEVSLSKNSVSPAGDAVVGAGVMGVAWGVGQSVLE